MAETELQITLLGTSFSIKSDESREYMEQVVRHYTKKLEDTRRGVSIEDPLKLAIITGLFLADDFYKVYSDQKGMNPQESIEAERITRELIENMDDMLKDQ